MNTNQTKQVEEFSSSTSKVKYTGKVVIKKECPNNTIKSDRAIRVHNTGTQSLFTFLCASLAGKYTDASTLKPAGVKVYYKDSDNSYKLNIDHVVEILNSPQLILTGDENSSDSASTVDNGADAIQFTFRISSGLLKDLSKKIAKLELVNELTDTTKAVLASVEFSDSNAIDLSDGNNVLIYWTLSFSNND